MMKLKGIKLRMLVVANNLPDTQIYTVTGIELDSGLVWLSYPTKNMGIVSGGTVEYSALQLPSHEQYRIHTNELVNWLPKA